MTSTRDYARDFLDNDNKPADEPAHHRELNTVALSEVVTAPVTWLWAQRIARRKLTLLVGDPGLGKSFLTLDLAARVSKGAGFPDCPDARDEPGDVFLLSAEDGLEDTIRPRLEAADADLERVVAVTGVRVRPTEPDDSPREDSFSLLMDLARLEAEIRRRENPRLVVIDPISAYMSGGANFDSHRNSDVRGALAPLSSLAERLDVAVIGVSHLSKTAGPAIYRTMGSLAFVAAARSVWVVVRDSADPRGPRRLFLPVKNNLGGDATGLAFELIRPSMGANAQPVIAWEAGTVTQTADEVMAALHQTRRAPRKREAEEWLLNYLSDGPKPAAEVVDAADDAGIKERTLKRAKGGLGIESAKAPDGGWIWSLPEGDPDAE